MHTLPIGGRRSQFKHHTGAGPFFAQQVVRTQMIAGTQRDAAIGFVLVGRAVTHAGFGVLLELPSSPDVVSSWKRSLLVTIGV